MSERVNFIKTWIECGLRFPYYRLEEFHTWKTIHRRICETCAEPLQQQYLITADCIAIDKDFNTNFKAISQGIIDYVDVDEISGEWYSIFDRKIPCSICGCIPKKII